MGSEKSHAKDPCINGGQKVSEFSDRDFRFLTAKYGQSVGFFCAVGLDGEESQHVIVVMANQPGYSFRLEPMTSIQSCEVLIDWATLRDPEFRPIGKRVMVEMNDLRNGPMTGDIAVEIAQLARASLTAMCELQAKRTV